MGDDDARGPRDVIPRGHSVRAIKLDGLRVLLESELARGVQAAAFVGSTHSS